MRIRCPGILVLLFLAAISAPAQKVKTGYDKSADFSRYKTYSWMKPEKPPARPLLFYQVMGSIDQQLQQKGLPRVEEGGDLLLSYAGGLDIGLSQAVGTPYVGTYSGVPYTLDATMWTGGWGATTTMAPYVAEGTLVPEFVDLSAHKVVWRGMLTEKLSPEHKMESMKSLDRGIAKLFEKFPPKSTR